MYKVTKYAAMAMLLSLACQFVPVQAVTLTELSQNQGQVLGATSPNYPYPNSSLVSDSGTIYFISGTSKVPFTSWSAFVGLGYSLKNVTKGDLSNYTLSSYAIKTSKTSHPWDSWVSYKKAIYYMTQQGMIGVPSYDIFLSNGGSLSYVVPANKYDLVVLKNNPNLPILTANDSRVNIALALGSGGSNVGYTNFSTSTFLSIATPSFTSSYLVFGSTSQKIASYTLTAPSTQPVNLNSVSINVQPNGTSNGLYNFANLIAKINGSQFGQTASTAAASIAFTGSSPVVVQAAGTVVVDIYADVLVYNGQQLTSLNPATTLASCAGVGVNDSAAISCNTVYGQNLSFVASTNTNSSPAISSAINPAFTGGNVTPGSTAVKIGSYLLTASASQGANLNSVTIGAQLGGGTSVLQNLFVKVNGNLFGTTQSTVSSQGNYTFTATSAVAIAAGQSATVDLYADIPAGSVSVTGLNPATTLMGCAGFGTANNGVLSCNLVNGQNINLYTPASPLFFPLVTTLNSAFTPYTHIFGSQNQQIGSFVITSTSTEAINVNSISVKVEPSSTPAYLQNVIVRTNSAYFAQSAGGVATPGATLTFNGYLSLGANGTATIDVYADVLNNSSVPITLSPASVLVGCSGYGVSDGAKVSCLPLNGQDAALATSTPVVAQ